MTAETGACYRFQSPRRQDQAHICVQDVRGRRWLFVCNAVLFVVLVTASLRTCYHHRHHTVPSRHFADIKSIINVHDTQECPNTAAPVQDEVEPARADVATAAPETPMTDPTPVLSQPPFRRRSNRGAFAVRAAESGIRDRANRVG
ncbi:hypothetical protein pclt_cds_767b [Pandoravirus celtis]|uniref:Uncharacterized protein n=1 Tax=Pandoravirus celtis TaxID=2568002 RepID=A0A4D6EHT8_9VIRU|nr:hypothetical protein pclt_cds_767b [Pandoravirus celtis]